MSNVRFGKYELYMLFLMELIDENLNVKIDKDELLDFCWVDIDKIVEFQ